MWGAAAVAAAAAAASIPQPAPQAERSEAPCLTALAKSPYNQAMASPPRRGRTLAAALLAGALLAACLNQSGSQAPCFVYGLTLEPSGIDPHINASSELAIALTSVYDTLVYQDPESGEFVPGLAERWTLSPDGTVYTFTLRSGVSFHDGTPFNAPAAVRTLERILDPELHSQKAVFMLGPLERAEAVDDRTLVLRLKQPYAPLLDSLSQAYTGMASPAALDKWGGDYALHQVGTGPFMFTADGYQSGVELALVRNPNYNWAPRVFQRQGPPELEKVCFRFYEDPPARAQALTSGEAQVVGEIPPAAAAFLEQDSPVRLLAVPIPGQPLQVFINSQRPPTDDPRVRRALLFAANRPAIITKVFADRSPLAEGPLSAATFAYNPAVKGLYPYDPARAAALLDEAGWRDSDGDGVRDRDGQPLQLEFVIQGWGFMPQVAALLEADWKAAGIDVLPPREVTFPQALQIAREGSFHVTPFFTSGSDPDLLQPFYHSQGGFNWSKVESPELDALLTEAATSLDPPTRERLYGQVQLAIMQNALIIPIRDYVNLNGVSPDVSGLRYDRRGWFPWLIDVSWSRGGQR
jgi:peptide/nickel transport system substrate-binding protein